MFTFQSIMFVSLGFLCALLLGFIVAPAFWARAVRLTTDRLRASLPLTETEIAAERDRLRAENAIRVHQLTARIEQARLNEARQKVEINRRDATISGLERRLQAIETEREGSENARRVLEATITQRIPEVEGRLRDTRQLLAKRDAEMKALQDDTSRTFRALDEAMQVNVQQRAEIDRLQMTLAGYGARTQNTNAETETALRAELEAMSARSREQAALIDKLQRNNAQANGFAMIEARTNGAANDDGIDQSNDVGQLLSNRKDGSGSVLDDAEIEDLKNKLATQTGQIETLKAQLEIYEESASPNSRSLSLRDGKSALKSRIAAADKELAARDNAIAGLRRELAQANERIAKQASHYMEELRRLGAGSGGKRGARSLEVEAEFTGGKGASDSSARADTGAEAVPPPLPSSGPAIDLDGHDDLLVGVEEARSEISGAPAASIGEEAAVQADRPPSLEERLARSGEQPADGFDTGTAGDEAEEPEPKDKLMDRIAALAKR